MSKSGATSSLPPKDQRYLRLRRCFDPLMVMYHHPVRLTVSLLIPFMLLPELSALLTYVFGIGGIAAKLIVMLGIIFLIFLPQLLIDALDCQYIHFDFYQEHFEFTETFFLREPIRVYYRSITDVTLTQNALQKSLKLSSIVFTIEARVARVDVKKRTQIIPDIKNAEEYLPQIQKIIAEYHAKNATQD